MKTKRPKYRSCVIIVQERVGSKAMLGSKSFVVYEPFEKVVNEVKNLIHKEDEKSN